MYRAAAEGLGLQPPFPLGCPVLDAESDDPAARFDAATDPLAAPLGSQHCTLLAPHLWEEEASVQLLHSRVQQLLRSGDREAAEAVLQQLEALDPCNPHGCHTRGMMAMGEGLLDVALAFFTKGLTKRGETCVLIGYPLFLMRPWIMRLH